MVIGKIETWFRSQAYFEDELVVSCFVTSFTEKKVYGLIRLNQIDCHLQFRIDFKIVRGDALVADGHGVMFLALNENGRAAAFPADMVAFLERNGAKKMSKL